MKTRKEGNRRSNRVEDKKKGGRGSRKAEIIRIRSYEDQEVRRVT
jgi:hypothetical protein